MTLSDIQRVKADFVAATRRARDAGFERIELHLAHCYLAQSFFSIHANQRQDAYGGNVGGRGRFLLETLESVRQEWPENLPLTARFGVIEYDGRDEETLEEAIDLTKKFRAGGLDLLSVSLGFSTPDSNIPWAAGFLAPVAERVRKEAKIAVASAWGIDSPVIANETIEKDQLDLVMVGRAHLANPNWPYQAAKTLKEQDPSWILAAPYAYWLERYNTSE